MKTSEMTPYPWPNQPGACIRCGHPIALRDEEGLREAVRTAVRAAGMHNEGRVDAIMAAVKERCG
jgi:hypothetical protein